MRFGVNIKTAKGSRHWNMKGTENCPAVLDAPHAVERETFYGKTYRGDAKGMLGLQLCTVKRERTVINYVMTHGHADTVSVGFVCH